MNTFGSGILHIVIFPLTIIMTHFSAKLQFSRLRSLLNENVTGSGPQYLTNKRDGGIYVRMIHERFSRTHCKFQIDFRLVNIIKQLLAKK